MSTRQTETAIATEIARLRDLKANVPHSNIFGDDHHAAIDAQIAVLEKGMSLDSIYDAYGNEDAEDFAQNVLDDAITARDWMAGDLAEDEGKPSDEWAELAS